MISVAFAQTLSEDHRSSYETEQETEQGDYHTNRQSSADKPVAGRVTWQP
jgi:hypothetical protein